MADEKRSKWEAEGDDDDGHRKETKKRKLGKNKSTSVTESGMDDVRKQSSRSTPVPLPPPPSSEFHALMGPQLVGCRNVDNYEKLNRISEGSYGIVYRARDKATGEIVALKKLKLDRETNGFPVTALREIHTLLLSRHRHIVNVKEIVTTPSLKGIFIAMEFVEHDLKSLMETMPSPFLQSEIKTLMQQLLSAINCLHSNWIIHRDLKTSNLLMNNRGEIKVADFELVNKEPMVPGKSELDQLNKRESASEGSVLVPHFSQQVGRGTKEA
ncbi:hypothetical protein HDU96_000032 [Phlyctochytrium bullatum]|nr:hypothetical protein HDU96_000032 [Phlyctochytrium bullatum]